MRNAVIIAAADDIEARFDTKDDAWEWMSDEVDDPCVDNYRFAYHDDPAAMGEYHKQGMQGCCGSFDATILVAGRKAEIGCNYGH